MPYFPKLRVKCALFGEAPLYFEKLAGALLREGEIWTGAESKPLETAAGSKQKTL
ncbi:hypothetical protein DPMN_185287 [Dreissena polymorpha]|uniref:Uncharacterized protein n=1 Tax=Dreissena polymorpha TaxID=45954 RepID=A0A9D4DK68_DREPO|nr:hypothetical protein DPMN_185287 [Dreissena polymorpha]